jgi:hypothetical protein
MEVGTYEALEWPIAEADKNGDIVGSSLVFRQLTDQTNVWRLLNLEQPQSLSDAPLQIHTTLLLVDTHGYHVSVNMHLKRLEGEEGTAEKKGWILELETLNKRWPLTVQEDQSENWNCPPPRVGLEAQFQEKMRQNPAPLFADFETYVKHLPWRQSFESETWLRLCEYPFYARSEDLEAMARRLESSKRTPESAVNRPIVKYAVSPSGTGKTSSIAAAFVESTKSKRPDRFSHYLYLAFANNKANNFRSVGSVSNDPLDAEMQGAEFMLGCLKKLLAGKEGKKHVQFSEKPPEEDKIKESIENLLRDSFVEGRILVHLDEHRKMNSNAAFRRGAMGLLARVGKVVVVATYTEPPFEINPSVSSEVCRFPVPVPALDIQAVIKDMDQLAFPADPSGFNGTNQRLWATLLFRLSDRVSRLAGALHLDIDADFSKLKEDFGKASQQATSGDAAAVSKALKECINLCCFAEEDDLGIPKGCDAVDLLLGLNEKDLDDIDAKIGSGLVAIPAKSESVLHTASLRALALHEYSHKECKDVPKFVFMQGADRFRDHVTTKDVLASTPLECAYVWTIASRSARYGKLKFGQFSAFRIACKEVLGGRLFDSHDRGSFSMQEAKNLFKDTIYYADESKRGKSSHPFGDIFFRTDRDEIVLIDVTGTVGRSKFDKKGRKLAEWTKQAHEQESAGLSFYGVVLAPLLDGESAMYENSDNVVMICGEEARRLLGGFVQCMAWFTSDTE